MRKVASFTDPFVLSQATAPNGDRFFGTGNDGKVYRLRGDELKLHLHRAGARDLRGDVRDGALLRRQLAERQGLSRRSGERQADRLLRSEAGLHLGARAARGGDVAGGHRRRRKALPRQRRRARARSSTTRPTRTSAPSRCAKTAASLAGASGKGRIYEIARDGSAHALFDSPLNEISSIYVDANGIGWAAAVSNVCPSAAPAKSQAEAGRRAATAAATVHVRHVAARRRRKGRPRRRRSLASRSTTAPPPRPRRPAAAEVYRIDADGFVETVRKFEREMVYAHQRRQRRRASLLATGPNGRVYELRGGELALLGAVPEKQIVSISGSGNATLITTTNTRRGLSHGIAPGARPRSSAPSPKDVERFSRFGNYRIEGRNLDAGQRGHRVPQRQHAHARRHVERVERRRRPRPRATSTRRRRGTSSGS